MNYSVRLSVTLLKPFILQLSFYILQHSATFILHSTTFYNFHSTTLQYIHLLIMKSLNKIQMKSCIPLLCTIHPCLFIVREYIELEVPRIAKRCSFVVSNSSVGLP